MSFVERRDRKKGTWYLVDFDDEQFGGYSVAQLETLLKECDLLALAIGDSLNVPCKTSGG